METAVKKVAPSIFPNPIRVVVDKAIDRRLSDLQEQSEILLNDLEVAIFRIESDGKRAKTGDIKVGLWYRASSELSVLQWFAELMEDAEALTLTQVLNIIQDQLQKRVREMQKSAGNMRAYVNEALQVAIFEENELNNIWGDIKVGSWHRASTEARVFLWLDSVVKDTLAGRIPANFDAVDETVDTDEDDCEEN